MSTQFNTAQLATLKAAIAAETDPTFVTARNVGDQTGMANYYKQPHATAKAWNKAAQWRPIFTVIDGAKYTPSITNVNAAADATATKQLLTTLVKLTVQQNMLMAFTGFFDARDSGNVDSLLDSVTSIYTLSGNSTNSPGGAGGVSVAQQLVRPALLGELLFGGTDVTKATTVTAKVLNWEGSITADDIAVALAS